MNEDELKDGRYESLVTAALEARLSEVAVDLIEAAPLDTAEAADRIGLFLARAAERAVAAIPTSDRGRIGIAALRRALRQFGTDIPQVEHELPVEPGKVLTAIRRRQPDGSTRSPQAPLTPLLDTTLLTNSPSEPAIGAQIRSEIDSADRIDIVMAFIRRSGIRPLANELRAHCEHGRPLRVLTTTYTGSTEAAALDLLHDLGADIRVSYNTSSTRLHAKAWLFHRDSGFSTAYIGSSNLTHSAQVTGLEWNVRISAARNRTAIERIVSVFETYFSSGDFIPYAREDFIDRTETADVGRVTTLLSPLEVRLEPFQERLLELIDVARTHERHRNLLVAATGTGKTVMAAVDYARLRRHLTRDRLLFVAHREELLDQSLHTFRHVLREPDFGEKWVGQARPQRFDHVFASIQSLNASGVDHLERDHFDVVIIDEFHHAAAPSYQALLDHAQPVELLGLTATPERADGLPILGWFDDRIAAELRLWDAIDRHYLVPFHYYGIHDGVDLTGVRWRRGHGYDTTELGNLYTGDQVRANLVIAQLQDVVGRTESMRCLGFCVSVPHARFMAEHFTAHGIPAQAVSGDTPSGLRAEALDSLRRGTTKVIFSVDLFNEGVDVPDVDVILMLRPTESPTLFLQQLGRGLRRAPGKSLCMVLDFIGNHRREFRFDRKYRALLGGSRRDLDKTVREGFPYLPAGAQMQLDRIAEGVVLTSLKNAIPSTWPAKSRELREVWEATGSITLRGFLAESGLELADVYDAADHGWSNLREAAGLPLAPAGPNERAFRRAVGRMVHMDDDLRLTSLQTLLSHPDTPAMESLTTMDRRLARMLASAFGRDIVGTDSSLQGAIDILWQHPQVRIELRQLIDVLRDQVDHVHHRVQMPDVPLEIHARYARGEILAAVGEGSGAHVPPWREGVYNAKDARADLLAFTLDKASGHFSPTTRYRDYAISSTLIHWESQSTTRESSPVGQRYQHHEAMGRSILLFARERRDERAFFFLGPARYVSHTGETPMAITWKLDVPLPGDLVERFAAAVA